MALNREKVPVVLSGGVNTKTDKKVLHTGLFLLENARRTKEGKYEKRYGSQALGKNYVGGSVELSDADALGVFNDELLQYTKQSVYGYAENADIWSDKGAALSCRVKLTDLVKNSYQQTAVDQAILGNIAVVAWEDSRGGVRCSVYDHDSGSQLLADTVLNASGANPCCVAFGSSLYVFYLVGADVRARQINPVNPLPLGGESTLSSSANTTDKRLDAIPQANEIIVCFNGGGTHVYMQRVTGALGVTATIDIGETAPAAVTAVVGADSRTFLLWYDGSNVRGAIYNVFGANVVAPFTVEAVANVEAITAYPMADGTGIRVFYQISAAATYNRLIRTCTVTNAGTPAGAAVFLRSVGLATKAWAYSPDTTDRGFVGIVHESTLQSTYFVARNDGFIVAKLASGLAGGLISKPHPSNVYQRSTGVFCFAANTKNPLVVEQGAKFVTLKGVSLGQVDFSDQSNFASVQLGENSHILGGIVSTYDGQSVVEHGFHLYPENITGAQSTSGSLTQGGEYQWCVVYQWTDAKGQIHRSAPSDVHSFTLTGANDDYTLTIPTLRLTAKKSPRTDVEIVVYRTEAGGTTFYRASSTTSPTYNNAAADTITFLDTLADSSLIAREPLYTSGGVIENIAPPSAAFGAEWKSRLALGGTEDGSIRLSKKHVEGQPVEFVEEFRIPFGSKPQTAVMSFLDKLLIFTEESISYIYGDGPDDLGNGEWSDVQKIPGDVGCVDPNSVVEFPGSAAVPGGVIFKSRKGFYRLGYDLMAQYIGDSVEDFNDLTVVSANVLADQNEVRFSTLEGTKLVYNYYSNEWATFPNTAANDAIIWKNQFIYVRRDVGGVALVVKEVPGYFQDVDQYYPMKVGIGWMAFAGLAGFQRLYDLWVLGEFKSAHKLRVRVGFDYAESYRSDHTWDMEDYLTGGTFGEDSPYGSGSVFGGEEAPYLVEVSPDIQKCTAARILLEDTNIGGSGESFNLTSLTVEIGIKRGGYKLPLQASA